jgi:hypothetical protein
MIFEDLLQQLHDPAPTQRIQALQVLALVEETRALDLMLHLYKHDPNSEVRSVAKWAGSAVWRAQQAGHSTEGALKALQGSHWDSRLEDVLIAQATAGMTTNSKRQNISDLQQEGRAHLEQAALLYPGTRKSRPPLSHSDTQIMQQLTAGLAADPDDLDLLDAGLVNWIMPEGGA